MRRATILAIGVLLLCAVAIPVHATTITVTNTNDSGPGSLRQALLDANDGDTITFAITGTIGLTSGELLVDKSITISGPGADNLAVDGNANSRVFHIDSARIVSISGLTITNGNVTGDFPNGSGGGIYNDHATLTISDCAINSNSATGSGGGILNDSSETGSATLTINNSTLNGNSGLTGGGIYNAAFDGGSAALTISNSTFSGNLAPDGFDGAIDSVGNFGSPDTVLVTIANSTLSGNSAGLNGDGDAISNVFATVDISNSILNGQASGEQIFNLNGIVTSHGYNLSSDDDPRFLTGPRIRSIPIRYSGDYRTTAARP
jgi:hypothetical protein